MTVTSNFFVTFVELFFSSSQPTAAIASSFIFFVFSLVVAILCQPQGSKSTRDLHYRRSVVTISLSTTVDYFPWRLFRDGLDDHHWNSNLLSGQLSIRSYLVLSYPRTLPRRVLGIWSLHNHNFNQFCLSDFKFWHITRRLMVLVLLKIYLAPLEQAWVRYYVFIS